MSDESKGRIAFLDYMRIFAFISVLIGHKFYDGLLAFVSAPDASATTKILGTLVNPLLFGGSTGVVVFFLTSGYIIASVLQRESTGKFVIHRIFRIYPLYIVAVLSEVITAHLWFGTEIPPAEIMIPRILLIGDFFNTPYALAGIEWTLRVEIMFYAFMAILKYAGILKNNILISATLVAASIILCIAPAIPHGYMWTDGYFNTYAPFLLLGTAISTFERATTKNHKIALAATGAVILWTYLLTLEKLHSHVAFSVYGFTALALFFVAWKFKTFAKPSVLSLLLAELTYSVYLFHNWAWSYLGALAWNFHIDFIPPQYQILFLLIVMCYILNKTIEKGGTSIGKAITKRINNKAKSFSPQATA